jgi:ribosomal protein S18 acetylase RimI-like enzyme
MHSGLDGAMNAEVDYLSNTASTAQIAEHLLRCDANFVPPLSGRVEIKGYAKKIASKATRFEAWTGGTLVGLVAAYCNDQEKRIGYMTSVSVLREWTGQGIAARLVRLCVEHMKTLGVRQISLEVASGNMPAIKLYENSGFVAGKTNVLFVTMDMHLKSGERK